MKCVEAYTVTKRPPVILRTKLVLHPAYCCGVTARIKWTSHLVTLLVALLEHHTVLETTDNRTNNLLSSVNFWGFKIARTSSVFLKRHLKELLCLLSHYLGSKYPLSLHVYIIHLLHNTALQTLN